MVKVLHDRLETLAFNTDEVGHRDSDVLKSDIGCVTDPPALRLHSPSLNARAFFDEEKGHSLISLDGSREVGGLDT